LRDRRCSTRFRGGRRDLVAQLRVTPFAPKSGLGRRIAGLAELSRGPRPRGGRKLVGEDRDLAVMVG